MRGVTMAKGSAYLAKLQAKKELEIAEAVRRDREFTMQWCADAAAIAANEVFRRKGEKIVEFMLKMQETAQEIAHMTLSDAKDDADIEYTKAKIDARLKNILGDAFQPWDERYTL